MITPTTGAGAEVLGAVGTADLRVLLAGMVVGDEWETDEAGDVFQLIGSEDAKGTHDECNIPS